MSGRAPLSPVSALRRLATLPLYAWRWVFTPLFPGGSAPYGCRYEPSCSHYAEEAIKTHGILRGSVMAAWRVLRCNPWSHGGYDPVRPR
jgi:putative membrane protein insertion efficiency factor